MVNRATFLRELGINEATGDKKFLHVQGNRTAKRKIEGVEWERLESDEKRLIDEFCYANIHNIQYYTDKLKKERLYLFVYFCLTFALLIGMPILIYNNSDGTTLELSGSIAALGSSLFALHKFASDWVDRRNYKSLFNEARVDLKNILFRVHENYDGRATILADGSLSKNGGYLTHAFETSLRQAIKESRALVFFFVAVLYAGKLCIFKH